MVPGLQDGTAYTFTVQAVNRAGTSAPSLPSVPVTVAPAGSVPSAPASVSVEPGDGAVSLHITAPSSAGGTPVTGYTISGPGLPTTEFTGQVTTGSLIPAQQTWVYGRAGRPCRRCGRPISSAWAAARSGGNGERVTFWCPHCQPG